MNSLDILIPIVDVCDNLPVILCDKLDRVEPLQGPWDIDRYLSKCLIDIVDLLVEVFHGLVNCCLDFLDLSLASPFSLALESSLALHR